MRRFDSEDRPVKRPVLGLDESDCRDDVSALLVTESRALLAGVESIVDEDEGEDDAQAPI